MVAACRIFSPAPVTYPPLTTKEHPMDAETKQDVLKRLAYIEGHLQGVRRMIEDDTYCVDVMKQTFAVRRAIEKLEERMLAGHLHHCVLDAIREGRHEESFGELLEIYRVANK
jgi:CsoR family transcriptional regulator, copper-sensing transcriptional repressor